MSALISLPSLSRHTRNRLQQSKRQSNSGVRSNVRLRARNELARAMACGLIAPLDVQQAVKSGDVAIAHLMQAHAVKPVLPELSSQSFIQLSPEPVTAEDVGFVKAWIKSFAQQGYIEADEISRVVNNHFDRTSCQQLLENSLQRLAEKVRGMLGDDAGFPTIQYQPISIEANLSGVSIALEDAFIATCPADVFGQPAFFRAFDGAMRGSRNRFLWGITTGLEESDGMTHEIIQDIALRATFENGHWQIPDDIAQTMEDEYGWDIEEMLPCIEQHLNHNVQRDSLKPMLVESEELNDWYKTAEPKQVAIIQTIHRLNALYSAYHDQHPVDIEMQSDYYAPFCVVLEANHGFNDTVHQTFDTMVCEEGFRTDIIVPNMAQLPQSIEAVLMDIAITHLIFNLVTNYE